MSKKWNTLEHQQRLLERRNNEYAELQSKHDKLLAGLDVLNAKVEMEYAKCKSFRGGQSANVLAQHEARCDGALQFIRLYRAELNALNEARKPKDS